MKCARENVLMYVRCVFIKIVCVCASMRVCTLCMCVCVCVVSVCDCTYVHAACNRMNIWCEKTKN